MNGKLRKLFKSFADDLNLQHEKETAPLMQQKATMIQGHRKERAALEQTLQNRWQTEEQRRIARIRNGFKGICDKITGRYWHNRSQNEKEAWQAHKCNEKAREHLIFTQLEQRQKLQSQIQQLREKQRNEKKALFHDLSQIKFQDNFSEKDYLPTPKSKDNRYEELRRAELGFSASDTSLDEPEI